MARVGAVVAGSLLLALESAAGAAPDAPRTLELDDARHVELVADRDDDDLDGVPDGEEAPLAPRARVDAVPLGSSFVGVTLTPVSGVEHARVLLRGRPVAWEVPLQAGAMLQGLSAGRVELVARRGREETPIDLAVTSLGFRDGSGLDVDLTRSHASLDRTPPAQLGGGVSALYDDPDALRVVVATANETAPDGSVDIESVGPTGLHLSSLTPPLGEVPCGAGQRGLRCFASEPIRLVIDDVDSRHVLTESRSIRAELGGAIVLRRRGRKAQAIRVGGPRDSPAGPIGRLRATLRPFVVRLTPGGVPSIGGNDRGAVVAMREEIAQAALAWGQCGVSFGPPDDIPVHLVDPPPPTLLSVGSLLGVPASGGGHVRVRIDDAKDVDVATRPGELPVEVAQDFAHAVTRAGFVARVSPSSRVASGAYASADVLVQRRGGAWVTLTAARGAALSDDATLAVRIGRVDLADGLDHFTDMDAVAGTLEERTLLKVLDDGDPTTIEVVVVPFFAGGGRIGESFIGTDHGSLRNVVVLDRAGVRARRTSLTLAHELGHVLLDVPGHPDDYGVDTPTRLMDADASDASPFGPRRLTLAECARFVRESGPGARVPLAHEWPMTPLVYR